MPAWSRAYQRLNTTSFLAESRVISTFVATRAAFFRLGAMGCRRFSFDSVQNARGIDQRGAGVHADGYAQGFRDFFPRRASLECSIRVKHDAAIAARGNRNGQRNELPRFLAKLAGLGVRTIQRQVSLQSVRRQFAELADTRADFLVILVPIHDHVLFSCACNWDGYWAWIILGCA